MALQQPPLLLVGHIVAQVSGQRYADFLAERILSPLGLAGTSVGGVPSGVPVARGYRAGQPVPAWDLDTMRGTGDIWFTAADLTRFTASLHAGGLLSGSSLGAMCTPHASLDDDDIGSGVREPRRITEGYGYRTSGYGYGMFTGTLGGHPAYYHFGDNPGYLSFTGWIPDQAASMAILVNDEDVNIDDLIEQLVYVALQP